MKNLIKNLKQEMENIERTIQGNNKGYEFIYPSHEELRHKLSKMIATLEFYEFEKLELQEELRELKLNQLKGN